MASLWRKTNSDWEKVTSTFPIEIPVQIGSVQTHTGTFMPDSNGIATLNCGFRPDIVFIYLGTYTAEGHTFNSSVCLPLFSDRTNPVESIAWGDPIDLDAQYYVIASDQTSTGCTIQQYQITGNWGIVRLQGTVSVPYTAYKFL